METKKALHARVAAILRQLAAHYPTARCSLDFQTPMELLVATVLSAQCTDERVNRVTPALFAKYRTAADYATADEKTFNAEIRPTGFFRAKTRNILGAARAIQARHDGAVPRTMEELTALPGIGRKSANVILGNAFGIPGIVVDTHVKRIAGRLGLTRSADPVRIELDLGAIIPASRWILFSHQVIAHGRALCRAPRPGCGDCFFDARLCPSRRQFL